MQVRRRYEGVEEDALQAPRANQIYHQQPGWFSARESVKEEADVFKWSGAGWYPGHGQIGAGFGRQVVPQLGKYAGQPAPNVGR